MSSWTLFLLLLLHSLSPVSLTQNDPADDEKISDDGESQPVSTVKANQRSNSRSAGGSSIISDDKYSFLRTSTKRQDNSSFPCMVVPEIYIPNDLKGKRSFGESCDDDPNSDVTNVCKRYTNVSYLTVDHKWDECMTPTHFVCDPLTKKCVCGHEGSPIAAIRFQVGDGKNKDKINGACFIRPTFDSLHSFGCTPGAKPTELNLDEEAEPVVVCGCMEKDTDKFNTADPEWWTCSKGTKSENYGRLFFMIIIQVVYQLR